MTSRAQRDAAKVFLDTFSFFYTYCLYGHSAIRQFGIDVFQLKTCSARGRHMTHRGVSPCTSAKVSY